MPDMLRLWSMLADGGLLAAGKAALPGATGFGIPRMQVAVEAVLTRGHGSRVVFELDHEAELAALEPGAAKSVLGVLGRQPAIVARLRAAPGFKALPADEQRRILIYVAGSTSLSTGGATAFDRVLADKRKRKDPDAFRKALHAQPGMAELATLPEVPPEAVAVRLEVPEQVNQHPFHSGNSDAIRNRVVFDDPVTATAFNKNQIDVMQPKKPPTAAAGKLPSVADVVSVLRRLGRPSRATIVRVDLNPKRNPDDKVWAKTPGYADANFRSDMSAGSDGVADVYPLAEGRTIASMVGALAHESGHAVSDRLWGDDTGATGTRAPTNAAWRPWYDATVADGFRTSKYAKASLHEDFAEAWELFTTTRGTPREAEVKSLMPHRYTIMAGVLTSEHTG
jgi:hypothetical protein